MNIKRLWLLLIVFQLYFCNMIEQDSVSDRFEPIGEGRYTADGISVITTSYYKPFSSHADTKLSIGDFYDPYLIKINNDFGFFRNFDPATSKAVITNFKISITNAGLPQNLEFSLTKTEYQGSTYVGFANFDQAWLEIMDNNTAQLKLNLVIGGSPYTINFGELTLSKDEIYTWRDLQGMKEKLDGEYQLMNPILFPQPGTDGLPGNGFEPVGSEANPFTGSLNGDTKAIIRLYIHRPSQDDIGLFGVVDHTNTVIKNLLIVYQKVEGNDRVGTLAGKLKHGQVENARVQGYALDSLVDGRHYVGGLAGWNQGVIDGGISEGNISGSGSQIGGLVGDNYGTVSGYAIGSVSGSSSSSSVGGLVGYNQNNGTVSGYATGSVSGSSSTGGLVGANYNDGTVSGYATGSVSGSSYTGGLVGYNRNYGTVSGYATGIVSGSSHTGGLVGANENNGTVSGYATGSVSGSSYTGGLVGVNYSTVSGYATGSVSGSSSYTGGLVGWNNGTVSGYAAGIVSGSSHTGGLVGFHYTANAISYGYWDIASSGRSSSAGGVGISSIYSVVRSESEATVQYTDMGNGNAVVFNQPQFVEKFDLPLRNSRWPILKASVIGEQFYQAQKALMGWTLIHNR